MEEQPVLNSDHRSPVAATGKQFSSKLSQYIRNGQALYFSSFFILILIEFLLGGQLSKILTRDNYSIYANVLNTLPFYNVIFNIGLSYAISYIIAYNPAIKFQLFRQTLKLQTLWYLLLVSVHVAVFFIFHNTYIESLLITAIITYTYTYRLNINSLFLATRSYHKAALANAMQKVTLIVVFMVIYQVSLLRTVLNDQFLPTYSLIELGVVALYFVVFWQTNRAVLQAPAINFRRRVLRYGKYAVFNNGLNLLSFTIIAFIIHSSHVDISIQIIFLLCIVFFRYTGVAIAPVFSIMTPLFTASKNDTIKVRDMYRKYFLIIGAISLLAVIVCRLFFNIIIDHFYAATYKDLPGYFYIFCYMIPLQFINSLNSSVLAALGRIKFTFATEVLCTASLAVSMVYNIWSPITSYNVFYYILLIYLALKFVIQTYGTYRTINK